MDRNRHLVSTDRGKPRLPQFVSFSRGGSDSIQEVVSDLLALLVEKVCGQGELKWGCSRQCSGGSNGDCALAGPLVGRRIGVL